MPNHPIGGSFSADASLISLEIRQDSWRKSPRPAKKPLAAGHFALFQTAPGSHKLRISAHIRQREGGYRRRNPMDGFRMSMMHTVTITVMSSVQQTNSRYIHF